MNTENLFYPLTNEERIESFLAGGSKEDAVRIFNNGMTGRFSIVGYEVNEVTPQPWSMRYALIKLFKGTLFNVWILLTATKEQLRAVDQEYNKLDEWVNCNRLYGARINKNGNILVSHPFEHRIHIHKEWPHTIIELRGDSHFCSHEFMDWTKTHLYVKFTTGLSGNSVLMKKIDKQLRRAKGDYERHHNDVRRYYSFEYKAKSWKYRQRVIAKIEVTDKGVNVRFIVTSNRNNKPETVYRRYCRRGTMELWIKDLKYFRADRMSCSSFSANMFRLFLYGAAYITAYRLKSKAFTNTEVEAFTMDSFMKRIMLSAVFIVEKKTFIRFSFSPNHRHLEALSQALTELSA